MKSIYSAYRVERRKRNTKLLYVGLLMYDLKYVCVWSDIDIKDGAVSCRWEIAILIRKTGFKLFFADAYRLELFYLFHAVPSYIMST